MKVKSSKTINETVKWTEISPGGIVSSPGSAHEFKTGDWRIMKPVWLSDLCKQCLLCVPICPDSSISVQEKLRTDFDYHHCKGCGICAKVCPFKASEFIEESK